MKREACSPSWEGDFVNVASPPGAAILPDTDVLRAGSRDSLPVCHMKRRSWNGEDMLMVANYGGLAVTVKRTDAGRNDTEDDISLRA